MKNYIFLIAVYCLFTAACTKNEVETPDFNVSVSKLDYKVGDTVTFQFQGKPDLIYYYAGEPGNNYDYRNRTAEKGTVTMSFRSRLTLGSTDPTIQQNTLRVLASTNFVKQEVGFVIDSAAIINAPANSWKDITNRFILPKVASNTQINSGVANITDLVQADNPLYIAFKYTDTARATLAQRSWYIDNFTIANTLADGKINNVFVLINRSPIPLFSVVNIKNTTARWGIGSTAAQINISGGPANTPDNEDWIVTRPINAFGLTPDKAIPIKSLSDNDITSYKKVFTTAGTYKVVFVANNVSIGNAKEVVRELTIQVTNK